MPEATTDLDRLSVIRQAILSQGDAATDTLAAEEASAIVGAGTDRKGGALTFW